MKKYENFDVCTAQALAIRVRANGRSRLSEITLRDLLTQYLKLPDHIGTFRGYAFDLLAERGVKLVAFSNGTESAVRTVCLNMREFFRALAES